MRISRLRRFTIALSFFAAAHAFAADPDSTPSFAEVVDVEVINIEVYVNGPDGRPLKGLTKDDFVLRESGDVVPITNFFAVENGRRLIGAVESLPDPERQSSAAEAPAAEPIFLMVYVDNLHLSPFSRLRVLTQLKELLRDRLAQGDRVMLAEASIGRAKIVQEFTDQWKPVDRVIDEMLERGSFSALREEEYRQVIADMLQLEGIYSGGPGGSACPPEMMRPARTYAQHRRNDALAAIEHMSEFVDNLASLPGRKFLLHLSDGLPQSPGIEVYEFMHRHCGGAGSADGVEDVKDSSTLGPGAYPAHMALLEAGEFDITNRYEKLTDQANANSVTFFTFEGTGPRALTVGGDSRVSWEHVDRVRIWDLQNPLFFLAEETGGRAFLNTVQFDDAMNRIEEDLGTYYSIGYVSPRPDGLERQIKVTIPDRKAQIRHRNSFRQKPLSEKLSDRTQGTLLFALVDNPLKIQLEPAAPQPMDGSLHVVPIRIKIPLGSLAFLPEKDVHRGRLSIYFAARDRNGRSAPVRSAQVPLAVPDKDFERARDQLYLYEVKMLMRPGEHTVAVGVHDDVGATASYVLQEVTVGESKKRRSKR